MGKKGPLKNAFLGLLFQIESGQFKRHETFNDAFCQNDYQKFLDAGIQDVSTRIKVSKND